MTYEKIFNYLSALEKNNQTLSSELKSARRDLTKSKNELTTASVLLKTTQEELEQHEKQLQTANELLKKSEQETKAENRRKRVWQLVAIVATVYAAAK